MSWVHWIEEDLKTYQICLQVCKLKDLISGLIVVKMECKHFTKWSKSCFVLNHCKPTLNYQGIFGRSIYSYDLQYDLIYWILCLPLQYWQQNFHCRFFNPWGDKGLLQILPSCIFLRPHLYIHYGVERPIYTLYTKRLLSVSCLFFRLCEVSCEHFMHNLGRSWRAYRGFDMHGKVTSIPSSMDCSVWSSGRRFSVWFTRIFDGKSINKFKDTFYLFLFNSN